MPIIRKQLKPSDVYPDDIRYDLDSDTIQSLIGDTWVDNPEADPRTQTTLPVRVTSDKSCDAAESIKDAFKSAIDKVLVAIEESKTFFSIASIILLIFEFGPWAVFISLAIFLAQYMLSAGATAISDSLTEENYHKFACILRCGMDGTTGRLKKGILPALQAQVATEIGGVGSAVLLLFMQLSGEGGMNNLASLGTSTGDCSDCDCEECPDFAEFDIAYRGTVIGTPTAHKLTAESTTVGSNDVIIFTSHPEALLTSTDYSDKCCAIYIKLIDGVENLSMLTIRCGHNYNADLSVESLLQDGLHISENDFWFQLSGNGGHFTVEFTDSPNP